MSIYNNLEKNNTILQNIDPIFIVNFINGPYLEIRNSIGNNYDVSFIDKKTGIVHYSTNVGNNCWTKSNISYFVDWKIIAKRDDGEVFEFEFDAKDKRVFIALESKSLGDTMAWFPYVDEFRKKWNCSVICSTFHNNLFIDQYPELEFVSPGSVVNGIYAMYKIGLFFDGDDINYKLHKIDPKKISLLEIATDILGLKYSEIRPRLKKSDVEKKKRVGIGFHSTAQTKYWNNPTGWQEVTDFLISKGYEVVIASKEEDGYMGNFYPKGATRIPEGNIENLIDELNLCEFFIGISSGLSWLAWAINIPVVIISGFTDENLEPSDNVVRIIEKSVCNGCWSRHKFDPGDWNWCPDNKGTERQFECTKSITGEMVINELINSNLVESESLCEIMKKYGSDKGLRICVTTIYDENMLEMSKITAYDNFDKYCKLNGYDLQVINVDYEKERPASWCKIVEVKKLLESNKYDWVFFIDLDCLFMNMTTKIESFIDDDYFVVFGSNSEIHDHPVPNKFGVDGVAGSQFLIKNCQLSLDFLDDVWSAVDLPSDVINKYDWEQRQFRYSIVKDKFEKYVKIIEGKLINAFWYTNDIFFLMKYKKYTKEIWEVGDFIVHVPGLHGSDRIKLLSDLSHFSGGYISQFRREGETLTFLPLINLSDIKIEIADIDNNLISTYPFDNIESEFKYWISMAVSPNDSFIFRAYNKNGELISAKIID